MFDTLEEQIEKSEGETPSEGVRAAKYIGIFVLSAVVFAVLYVAIRLLE